MQLAPHDALSSSLRQTQVAQDQYTNFVNTLRNFLERIEDGQREETQKVYLRDFLQSTFYAEYDMPLGENDIDLAIRLHKSPTSRFAVLFEVKTTTNRNEMISRENLNRKALQELLLYYLRERVLNKNTDLRHLVVTNLYEYFIFDAQEFEESFYKPLREVFLDYDAGRKTFTLTRDFYTEIAAPAIDAIQTNLRYTYCNLQEVLPKLETDNEKQTPALLNLYKLFSPTHLLKEPETRDTNKLDSGFYNELLHLIGLVETRDTSSSKNVIVRVPEKERNHAALIEQTISWVEEKFVAFPNAEHYGANPDEQVFNISLELCIIWLNRILFLKLLEAQLLQYHEGAQDVEFLNKEKLHTFSELNTLFFQILAREPQKRVDSLFSRQFKRIPYLNSSLFEETALERATLFISELMQQKLPLYPHSVLRKYLGHPLGDTLPILDYLLDFLDAYDFSSSPAPNNDNNKTVVNAAVLGLFFEKINGHRDGSIFTPSYVTMFVCRETILRTALQKFNERYGWSCKTFEDLYNQIDKIPIAEANDTLNSLRICDPAVGSGHFLVSALNEFIEFKFRLDILQDDNGQRIRKRDYTFAIQNDELLVTDERGIPIEYHVGHAESQRIQEVLFREKRYIIEHCLFGVDINPISVQICRLRLWMELLKNAYYTAQSQYQYLETLPNIDINIRCGNSLIYLLPLDSNISTVLENTDITPQALRKQISEYQNTHQKAAKYALEAKIHEATTKLKRGLRANDQKRIELQNLRTELQNLTTINPLFERNAKEQKEHERQLKQLTKRIAELEAYFYEQENNRTYYNAFEWRIEFPEVWDAEGNFVGFDAIIGNPPYIQLQSLNALSEVLKRQQNYDTYNARGDVYTLFYELGYRLLRPEGILCFITSNKWMRAGYGAELREFLARRTAPELLLDFGGIQIFESATVDTNILLFAKGTPKQTATLCATGENAFECLKKTSVLMKQLYIPITFKQQESWVILTPIEAQIKQKIEQAGTPLRNWDIRINYGIKTGYNDAFIIDSVQRDAILSQCQTDDEREKTAAIIRPILRGRDIKRYGYEWAGLYLIATFPSKNYNIEDYPAIRDYLLSFGKERLEQTGATYIVDGKPIKSRKATNNQWFETQDSISYSEDFLKPVIAWQRVTQRNQFCLTMPNMLVLDSMAFISNYGEHKEYLLAILNSNLFFFWMKKSVHEYGNLGFRLSNQYVEQFPISHINNSMIMRIKTLVNNTIDSTIEREINTIVYQLYGLTEIERKFVEETINRHPI